MSKPEKPWSPPAWTRPSLRLVSSAPAPKGLLEEGEPGIGKLLVGAIFKGLKPVLKVGLDLAEVALKELAGLQAALKKYGRHLPKCDRKDPCSCGWTSVVKEFLPKGSV